MIQGSIAPALDDCPLNAAPNPMLELLLSTIAVLVILPMPFFITGALINSGKLLARGRGTALRQVSRGIITAALSLVIAVLTRPFPFLNRIASNSKDRDKAPILLIHGLYHNNTAWLYIKHRLAQAGFTNLHTLSYNSFTTSYPELVKRAREEINRLHDDYGYRKVTIIGHSLGGLITCGALSSPETKDKCRAMITLGTPYRGSFLANIAIGHLGRSLHPKSAIFSQRQKVAVPDHIPALVLYSPVDEMVQPWSSLLPEKADIRAQLVIRQCRAMGHVAMLFSPQVSELITDFLLENTQCS